MILRNILFATQPDLPATSPHSRRSDVDIFRSVVSILQYPRHGSQPPVLSANSLCWSAAHWFKILSSFDRFIQGKRWKSQGAKSGRMMMGDQTLPIEKASGASFLAAAVCGRSLSRRRKIPEDNFPRRLFWIKESNYSTHSTFGGRLYCFRHVYGLSTPQNWQVRCVAIDGHTRDIAQHIGLPPVQFLAGLYRNSIHCPGSQEKGAWSVLSRPKLTLNFNRTSVWSLFSYYIDFKNILLSKFQSMYRITYACVFHVRY